VSLYLYYLFLSFFLESQEGDHQDLINDHENMQEFIEFSINPSFESQNYEIEPQGYLKFVNFSQIYQSSFIFLFQTQSPIFSHLSF